MGTVHIDVLTIVKGGGDLGTGVAWRLHRCGFRVLVTETAQPTVIRRAVAFASAVYEGTITVDGITARRVENDEEMRAAWEAGEVPVIVDPEGESIRRLRPDVVVDAIIAKRNIGTRITDAPIVIALGPGFTRRVLRAPAAGTFRGVRAIGDRVQEGEVVAYVDDVPVRSQLNGVVRGLLHDGLPVHKGMKVGDVDPRGIVSHCFTISEKALAIGGGVVEAILYLWRNR